MKQVLKYAWGGVLTAMGLYTVLTTLMFVLGMDKFALLTLEGFLSLIGFSIAYGLFALVALLGLRIAKDSLVMAASIVMLLSAFLSLIGFIKLPFLEIPIIGGAIIIVSIASILRKPIIKLKPEWD